MARASFLNTILTGKIGGSIYSRNRWGYYVKQFSLPTNPNTAAQQIARSNFTNAVESYHALGDALKAAWQNYAEKHYNPKFNLPCTAYSGMNAFVALKMNCNMAQTHAPVDGTLQLITNEGAFVGTERKMSFEISPPVQSFEMNQIATTSVPPVTATPSLTNVTFGQDGSNVTIDAIIKFDRNIDKSLKLMNADGISWTLAFFISLGIKQTHNYVGKHPRICLGVLPYLNTITTTPADEWNELEVKFTSNTNPANYKAFPSNSWVRTFCYFMSKNGEANLLGTYDSNLNFE